MEIPGGVQSAHVDQLARSLLPPEETWPVFDYFGIEIGGCPDYVNAVEALLDTTVVDCFGDKPDYHNTFTRMCSPFVNAGHRHSRLVQAKSRDR